MVIEFLLLIILAWDGYFFLKYLLSLTKAPKTSALRPKVSLLMPAHNEEKTIGEAIRAALNLDYPDFEIIVIDDGSSDKTYDVALTFKDPRLKVVRIPHSGKARALNEGLKLSSGEIIATTDADGVLEGKALKGLVERFYADDVVAVGGQVRVQPRSFLEVVQDIEHLRIAMFRRAHELENLSVAPGPIAAFRRKALEAIGGFVNDPVEDYATTVALKGFGKVVYSPKAKCWVRMPTTLANLWRQRKRWFLGDLPKLGGGPLKEKVFLGISDIVAFFDVLFPVLAIFAGKFELLAVFLLFEVLTMATVVAVEGGYLVEVLAFPFVLWFLALFYLTLHVYGYLHLLFRKKQ
ncbi:glycosyltransferase [Thermococcus gorgonarius]|uniref:Glycosyl transferase n=1 Tax=Thermococcus gorgonarius TaxID=71997 RepID=A0A2Z2M9C7_THEGO|nr:glycosyltransferase family 2 protein [Thermococcus gorgonarius]ASJ00524.1 glycosyl transferase [Thermococcus gorgonarius]